MSLIEVYVAFAPLVLAVVLGGAAVWWSRHI